MKKLLFILTFISTGALGQIDGTFDPNFGTNGQVQTCVTGTNSIAIRSAIQNDNKIVIVGATTTGTDQFLVVRYITDGTLDQNFGSNGIVTTSFGVDAQAQAIALQPDNKIIAAGFAGTSFALARYTSNGSLDSTFGTSGIVHDTTITSLIQDIAVQPDGKIVAVVSNASFNDQGVIVRYNPNGTRDTSFGTGGVVTPIVAGSTIGLRSVQIQNDNKLVVAGIIRTAGVNRIFIARYLPNGAIDTSFGNDGFQTVLIGVESRGRDSIIQFDGQIVVLAQVRLATTFDFALVRFTPNGTLDASFGTNGVSTLAGFTNALPSRVNLQTDGKIIGAGSDFTPSAVAAIVRYNVNGTLDSSFGSNGTGRITHQILNNNPSQIFDASFDAQGQIISPGLAGSCIGLVKYEINSLHFSTLSQALWQTYYNQNIKVLNR